MKIIQAEDLSYVNGPSDQAYNIKMASVGEGSYVVHFEYGRRGETLTRCTATPEPVSFGKAVVIYLNLRISKILKGYVVTRQQGEDEAIDTLEQKLRRVPLIPAPRTNKRRLRVAM